MTPDAHGTRLLLLQLGAVVLPAALLVAIGAIGLRQDARLETARRETLRAERIEGVAARLAADLRLREARARAESDPGVGDVVLGDRVIGIALEPVAAERTDPPDARESTLAAYVLDFDRSIEAIDDALDRVTHPNLRGRLLLAAAGAHRAAGDDRAADAALADAAALEAPGAGSDGFPIAWVAAWRLASSASSMADSSVAASSAPDSSASDSSAALADRVLAEADEVGAAAALVFVERLIGRLASVDPEEKDRLAALRDLEHELERRRARERLVRSELRPLQGEALARGESARAAVRFRGVDHVAVADPELGARVLLLPIDDEAVARAAEGLPAAAAAALEVEPVAEPRDPGDLGGEEFPGRQPRRGARSGSGEGSAEARAALPSELAFLEVRAPARLLDDAGGGTRRAWLAAILALLAATVGFGSWHTWRTARREAEVSRMKTEFVARVSHELKTPLASIRLFAEMLESGRVADEEKRQRYHRVILGESERLTRLIERVLGFARMERGEPMVAPRPDSIEDIVRQTVAGFDAPGSEAEPVTIDLPDLPTVSVDRDALSQMLWNLLDNARKYSDGGPVRIEGAVDASEIRIGVIDRGPGIPADERERVFERFRRGAGDLTRGVGGVGLGLSIAAHLARAHGGSIEVAGEPGGGSRFTIRLPRAEIESGGPGGSADPVGTRESNGAPSRGERNGGPR